MDFSFLLDALFPSACAGCDASLRGGGVICDACFESITMNRALLCGRCGSRLPTQKKICHRDVPYLLGAAVSYESPGVKNLIHALKFRCVRSAAEPLAELLTRYVRALALSATNFVIVPIPLSTRRLRERGFNQSELIAESLHKNTGIPYAADALFRRRHAPPQSDTGDLAARRENVREAFLVGHADRIARRNVFLVDDVVTSGATLTEAARALKACGARKIIALVVAKA